MTGFTFNGCGDRIRTYAWRIQSPQPYRLATPQYWRKIQDSNLCALRSNCLANSPLYHLSNLPLAERGGVDPHPFQDSLFSRQVSRPLLIHSPYGRERRTRTGTPDYSEYWRFSKPLPYQLGLVLYNGAPTRNRTLDPLIKS